MPGPASHRMLPDGRRLHLQHGPIDIVAEADGPKEACCRARGLAVSRFETVLEEIVSELELLRCPWRDCCDNNESLLPQGSVARRMIDAVSGIKGFITPMASVAGSVADEILEAMLEEHRLQRVFVNNGGDIALWLSEGTSWRIGVFEDPGPQGLNTQVDIEFESLVRGVATSGWRGRSQSFGIADSVTVLARNAAKADTAATLIANEVNTEHPGIWRRAASEVVDDSDLGDRAVTVSVPKLPQTLVEEALERGTLVARNFLEEGLIEGAYLSLQYHNRTVCSPGRMESCLT